jgi:hypothetical protein
LCPALLLVFMAGCAGTPVKAPEQAPFEVRLDQLIDGLIANRAFTPEEMAPTAVMPGALKSGTRFSRLEELVMERLALALRKQNDFYTLSRQNWFAYREGRPLTFMDQPTARQRLLRNLVVYEVGVSPDRVLGQVKVRIMGTDADGRAVPGVAAEGAFDFGPNRPARRLYDAEPGGNPYPKGLEENPYESIDQMTYSLASELADAYRNGILTGEETAAHEEVRVLLYTKHSGESGEMDQTIQDSLQQSIVGNRGFTCVVSRKDFGPAFEQIDFYRRNNTIFDMEESLFTAGTVLLMMDTFPHRRGGRIGVTLRGIWRTDPLETAAGNLIYTNVAGTYLSGFTAKAYLRGSEARRYSGRGKIPDTPGTFTTPKPVPTYTDRAVSTRAVRPGAQGDLDICFYESTSVFQKRIYPVLSNAPGVTEIRRLHERCEGSTGVLCYELWYDGSVAEISRWLTRHLRTSKVLAFRLEPKGEGRLNVHFDGGFK